MTTPQTFIERFMRSPLAAQLEASEAADLDASRRAAGERIAHAERERAEHRPPVAAKLDKLVSERAALLEKLTAKNAAINAARAELADLDTRAEHTIAVARRELRETQPAAIPAARRELETMTETQQRAGYDSDVEEPDTFGGKVRELKASNYASVQRRFAALFAARDALNALAERYVEDVDAEIAAIFATIPDAVKEPVKAGELAGAA